MPGPRLWPPGLGAKLDMLRCWSKIGLRFEAPVSLGLMAQTLPLRAFLEVDVGNRGLSGACRSKIST
jgi:hypothetical protein